MKLFHLAISVTIYLLFWVVFTYLLVFLGGPVVSQYFVALPDLVKTVGNGPELFSIPWLPAVIANAVLIVAFGMQHSIMARLGFKSLIVKFVPKSLERSVYVLATCVVLTWFYLAWQPIPTLVWQAQGATAYVLIGSFLLGAGLVLWSTFMISHTQLFGIGQAWHAFTGKYQSPDQFITPAMYKFSRHPMYLGILIVFWSTPIMTVGHLVAASLFSIYVFIGIGYEERDLLRQFGDQYRDYMQRVPQLLPIGFKRQTRAEHDTSKVIS